MTPTRVLHVLEELQASGAERMLQCAAPQWPGHGVRCEILSKARTEGPFGSALRDAGYVLHQLPSEPQSSYPLRLRAFLRHHTFDVVHNHSEHANFWTAMSARSAGVRRVLRTVHNNFTFTGPLRAERVVQRHLLRQASVTTVAIGESVQANELQRFHNPSVLIHNWFDSDAFRPSSAEDRTHARSLLGLPLDAQVVVLIGNCSPVKNHCAVLRAMAQPELRQALLVHVGREADDSERLLSARLGVADRVRFLGQREDVQTALAAGDVFAMPSLYEGFSIAALEALGTGMPVVLAKVPGLIDFQGLGDAVSWWDPRDSLSRTLSIALGGATNAAIDREQRHALVKQAYGVSRGVAAYADLYAGQVPAPR